MSGLAEIYALAREGKTSREIGAALGIGKNAVLGRVHRAGVKLGDLNGWTCANGHLQKGARRGRRKGIPWNGVHEYPHRLRVEAVAAYQAGVSMPKIAAALGISYAVIRAWRARPEVVAEAQALAAQALASLAAARQAETARLAQVKADAAATRALHNLPILAQAPPREGQMVRSWERGAYLREIADEHGLTRERVRQILCRLQGRGVQFERPMRGSLALPRERMAKPRYEGPDRRGSPERKAAHSARMKAFWAAAKANGL